MKGFHHFGILCFEGAAKTKKKIFYWLFGFIFRCFIVGKRERKDVKEDNFFL